MKNFNEVALGVVEDTPEVASAFGKQEEVACEAINDGSFVLDALLDPIGIVPMGIDAVAKFSLGESLPVCHPWCALNVIGGRGEEDINHGQQRLPPWHGRKHFGHRNRGGSRGLQLAQTLAGRAGLEDRTQLHDHPQVFWLKSRVEEFG